MALKLGTQGDVGKFLKALKKAVSQKKLGVLTYEKGTKTDRYGGRFIYYGAFSGPIKTLLHGKGEISYPFDSSEVDVGFAFTARNEASDVISQRTGARTASHFTPYSWSSTGTILIYQIQLFSRDCLRKLARLTDCVTEEGIASLDSLD